MNSIDDFLNTNIGLDDDDIGFDPDEPAWDRLIEQIVQGNVIPVIGPDILCDCDEGNIHTKLVEYIAKRYNIESNPISFSELMFDHDYLKNNKSNKDSIYAQMNKIFAHKKFIASGILKELLSIRQFPFVITTSFTPLVEDAMREVWGNELRVMRFNNNPSENHDIKGGTDMRKPTIYYMFGKVGEGSQRYVLSDTDMLDFCSSWLSDVKRPRNLADKLKNKYLLILGNTYSDWLFRFIWYSIRKSGNIRELNGGGGLYAYDKADDELHHFLERNHTFLKENPKEIIDQIKKRLAERLAQYEATKFDKVENHTDIFISYSRSDSEIAESLYNALTQMGKRVWYDRNNISYGGNFIEEIKQGIRTARYFIPLFTHHIEEEKNDPHVYRNEWDEAITVGNSLGRKYIIPISEEGFDFYKAAIPDKIQQRNAIIFKQDGDLQNIAEKIIHTISQE